LLFTTAGILFLTAIVYLGYNNFFITAPADADGPIKIHGKSIAVLPFNSLSDSSTTQDFIDGVMEEILTNLSRIHDLRVVSRTSVEQFRESTKSTSVIARKLDVDYIVEGSGQKYGNTFLLRVQLIEASTDKHIWANSYEEEIREIKGIFKIQSQIAHEIAAELHATITPEEKQLIDKIPTSSLTAYDFFLRGQDELNIYKSIQIYRSDWINKQALKKAEIMFNKALGYDSAFGRAYIGLADIYWAKHWSETYLSENFLDSVLILANRALSYDNQLAAGFYYRGEYFNQQGETGKALQEYNIALRYNPNYWEVYFAVGQNVYLYNYAHMDFVKGLEYLHKAVSINHGKELPFLLRELGDAYGLWAGFPDKRKYYFLEAVKLDYDTLSLDEFSTDKVKLESLTKKYSRDSGNLWTILNLARTYAKLGQYKESLIYTKKYENRLNERSYLYYSGRTGIGYTYWMNGYKKEAEKWFNEQIRISEESLKLGRNYSMDAYCDLANIYALTGQREKAYESLRSFSKNHLFPYFRLVWIKEDPMLNSIRDEPGFQKIVKEMESKYLSEHERVRKWLEEQEEI
jgi:TolB-like protein